MHYDPIKDGLGRFFNKTTITRKIFYQLLDLLLLRTWHIHREIKKWFSSSNKEKVQILDAGCGFGQYSFWMARNFPKTNIHSVDVKSDYLEDCKQFFAKCQLKNVIFEVGDLTNFPKPNSYHLIVCVDVMEHILEDVDVFKHFHHNLVKGGMVLISTPSDQGGSDVHKGSDESFIGEHVRDGYNKEEIIQKLKTAGFNNVEVRYSYGTPGKISWKLSMKYPILMLNKSKLFYIIIPIWYLILYPFCYLLNYLDARGNHITGTGLIVKAWKD